MEKRYSIRLNNDNLIKFADMQSNFTDAIRFLIEKEISKNGIRNLQKIIPAKRDEKYFKEGCDQK